MLTILGRDDVAAVVVTLQEQQELKRLGRLVVAGTPSPQPRITTSSVGSAVVPHGWLVTVSVLCVLQVHRLEDKSERTEHWLKFLDGPGQEVSVVRRLKHETRPFSTAVVRIKA